MTETGTVVTIERVKLSELAEDQSLYPRGSVSEVRVSDLVYALDAGDTLPAIVIDRATRTVVDGVHRSRAHRRRLGEDGTIEAEVREFDGPAAMLLTSARLNSMHGLPLGRYDQRVVVIRARQLGATDEEIAGALRVTPTRLLQVTIRQADSDGGPVALKCGADHLAGAYLTADQVREIRRMRGAPAKAKAQELARLLRQDIAPVSADPGLRLALAELAAVIEAALSPYAGG